LLILIVFLISKEFYIIWILRGFDFGRIIEVYILLGVLNIQLDTIL